MKAEDLLCHAGFVRSLARGLVADENLADDIEQQTWLAALTHPPREKGSLSAWLARVALNAARVLYRSEASRKGRERTVSRDEAYPSPEEIVQKMEIRRLLIDAVLDLEEPYRSAIVLRFFDGLPVRKIADRFQIPRETVKTRLKRGLQQLRHKLDERHGGDRGKWLALLVPIAGLKFAGSAAAAASPATLLAGAMAMGTKAKIVLAALLLVGAFFGLRELLRLDGDDFNRTSLLPEEGVALEGDSPGAQVEPDPTAMNSTASAAAPAMLATPREALAPKGIRISGKVTDKKTGGPVTVFEVDLLDKKADHIAVRKTFEGQGGRFIIPIEHGGLYELKVSSSRHLPKVLDDLEVSGEEGIENLLVVLDPGLSVSGKVVEDATGKPVEGVLIGTDYHTAYMVRGGQGQSCAHTESDEKGRFLLGGLKAGVQKIGALHPDFAEAWVEADPNDGQEIELCLKKGCRIFGKAFWDDGKPAAGIEIDIDDTSRRPPLDRVNAITGSDGSYRSEPYLPCELALAARRGWNADRNIPFTYEVKVVQLEDQDLEVNFGILDEYVTWQGVFYDFEGKPVSKGRLVLRQDPERNWNPHLPPLRIECDDEGRFEVRKLSVGYYVVRSEHEPRSRGTDSIVWQAFHFEKPGPVERDIRSADAVLSGKVIDGATNRPIIGENGRVTAAWAGNTFYKFQAEVDEEGCFAFKGLPAGAFNLLAEASGNRSEELKNLTVSDGQVIDDLRLVIFRGGKLVLKATNFLDDWSSLALVLEKENGSSIRIFDDIRSDRFGNVEESFFVKPGDWIATVFIRFACMVVRYVEIEEKKTTELLLDRDELAIQEEALAVKGSLRRADGTLIPDVRIVFRGVRVPGPQNAVERLHSVHTDKEGRFFAEGFRPGWWRVEADRRTPGMNWVDVRLPDLVIPPDPPDPFLLELVLPEGKIEGTLHDHRTGEAFDSKGPQWTVLLEDAKRKERMDWFRPGMNEGANRVVCFQSERGTSRFELLDVPAGTYRLLIDAIGFHLYQSEPFSLNEGQEMDAGKILLDPCGVLYLDVKDAEGKPIEQYRVFCDGSPYQGPKWGEDHWVIRDNLPLSSVQILIHKEGYKDIVLDLDLKPGEPTKEKVIMKKE